MHEDTGLHRNGWFDHVGRLGVTIRLYSRDTCTDSMPACIYIYIGDAQWHHHQPATAVSKTKQQRMVVYRERDVHCCTRQE